MKKFFTLFLAFVGLCSAQAAFFDFEDSSANAQWQFIQDGQTNYWTVGTSAGSASSGSNALYITSNGASYAYNNGSSSVSWAYIPVTLTGAGDEISFSWKCLGEGSHDYLRVYLFPEGTLPTAGSTSVGSAISLTNNLNGQSDWQTISINPTASVGLYNLCFIWRNDGSAGSQPIAIDDVQVETPIILVQNQVTYVLHSNGTATLTSIEQGYVGALVIPTTITHEGSTYTVTSIASNACKERTSLTSLAIPEGVTFIGNEAFRNCDALTSVVVPEGVTTIGQYAFNDCDALVSITVPSSVTTMGSSAFYSCDQLSWATLTAPSVEAFCNSQINNKLQNVGAYNCSRNLQINGAEATDIVVPNSVDSIYDYTFYLCSSLTSVTIPEGVTHIGNNAFYNCDALTSITLPEGVTHIGNNAFNNCYALTSVVMPNSVTTIGSSAFSSYLSCVTLTSPSIEAYCNGIGNALLYSRFNGARKIQINGAELTDAVIPNTVDSIYDYAFYNCTNLKSVTIPESVTSIGNYAFANDEYLSVYTEATTPAAIGGSVFAPSTFIFVSDVPTYKAAWVEYKELIADKQYESVEVTTAALSSKSGLHQTLGLDALLSIVKLKVNGTINSYDIMMLRNQMPLLRELDLSDASILATENGYEYTEGCTTKNDTLTTQSFTGTGTKIIKVVLPKSLKHIEAGAFNTVLRELTVHNGTIAEYSFDGLNELREVTLLNATAISRAAFRNCSALHTISLPNTLQTIGVDAFYNCSSLQSISLPESLETIDNYAFQGAGLRSITIPANVSHLGYGAFAGRYSSSYSSYGYYSSATATSKDNYYASTCYSSYDYYYDREYCCYNGYLREVTIPKNSKLKTIPSRAFEGNGSLTKLSILGDSITTIEDVAFRRCQLDTLILPPNLTSLSTLSFGHCTGLKYIAMPKSLTEIPANAFVGCTFLNDVQFPTKLTTIGHHAFADCTYLSNVDIPGLVTTIGDFAFKDCNVNQVHSYLFDPFTIGQNTFSAYANANAILFIPNVEDTEMKYLYDTQWSQFLNRVRMDGTFNYDDFYATGDVIIGKDDEALNGEPNADLNPGSGLVVEEGDTIQNLGTVTLNGEVGDWASLIAGCNLNVDTLVLKINVQSNKWHFFGFPFQIKIADIVADGKFVVYEYDAQIRAERDTTGWKKIPSDQEYLYPGHGYIFNFSVEGSFSIKVNKPDFCNLINIINLAIHPSSNPTNQNWNYLANPFLAYYDILDLNYTGPITFWDVLEGTYRTMRAGDDEYYLSPYEAFFLQNIGDTPASITFDRDKGMTKKQKEEKQIASAQHAPAKRAAAAAVPARALINLTLSNGEQSDDTRVVINDNATLAYDLGADAAKFMSSENVPQLFSYDQNNNMCAINERPMGEGTINLGVKLPAGGLYTISCARMDTTFFLLDREENYAHDLQLGEYQFEGKTGINSSRFALVRRYNAPTGVEDIVDASIETTKNGLYINGQTNVQIYSVSGVLVAEGQFTGFVPLAAGVYLVNANGTTSKHVIQ